MPEARGRPCTKCGADEWNHRTNGAWYCAKCNRLSGAKRADLNGGATKLLDKAKERAKSAGLDFTLTAADIEAVWPVDGKCPALGITLVKGKGNAHDASPTLDRLNPAWGYTRDNIAVLSFAANRVKNNARASDLEKIAAWMRSRGLD